MPLCYTVFFPLCRLRINPGIWTCLPPLHSLPHRGPEVVPVAGAAVEIIVERLSGCVECAPQGKLSSLRVAWGRCNAAALTRRARCGIGAPARAARRARAGAPAARGGAPGEGSAAAGRLSRGRGRGGGGRGRGGAGARCRRRAPEAARRGAGRLFRQRFPLPLSPPARPPRSLQYSSSSGGVDHLPSFNYSLSLSVVDCTVWFQRCTPVGQPCIRVLGPVPVAARSKLERCNEEVVAAPASTALAVCTFDGVCPSAAALPKSWRAGRLCMLVELKGFHGGCMGKGLAGKTGIHKGTVDIRARGSSAKCRCRNPVTHICI